MTILQSLGSCIHEITLSHGLPLSLFTAGLVGGFTHCASMCGPFVLSQTGGLEKARSAMLLPYHAGRITTYVVMAAALASLVNVAFLFLPIRSFIVAPILMTAGLIFLASAFPAIAGIFPWAATLRLSAPYRFIERGLGSLSNKPNLLKQYGMGLLLGFVPCGLIVSALMAASTAPNALQAALAMGAFGAGTMPALVAVGLGGSVLQARHPAIMQRVKQGMMIISSLWLFALAGFLLI